MLLLTVFGFILTVAVVGFFMLCRRGYLGFGRCVPDHRLDPQHQQPARALARREVNRSRIMANRSAAV